MPIPACGDATSCRAPSRLTRTGAEQPLNGTRRGFPLGDQGSPDASTSLLGRELNVTLYTYSLADIPIGAMLPARRT
jgi:hypothetical protein